MLTYPMTVTKHTHCPIAHVFFILFFCSQHTLSALSWAFVIWPENLTLIYNNASMRKFFQLPNTVHKNKLLALLAPFFPKLSPQLTDTFVRVLFTFALLRSLSWLKFASLCCISVSENMPEFQRNVWIGHSSHFLQRPHSQSKFSQNYDSPRGTGSCLTWKMTALVHGFSVPWDGWNFQLTKSLTSVLATYFPDEQSRA